MKRFLLKIGTIIMLSLSILFGSAVLPNTSHSPLTESAYATPTDNSESGDESSADDPYTNDDNTIKDDVNVCSGVAGSVSWALCPLLNMASGLVDSIYNLINDILVIKPISTDHNSAIYKVWQKACEITNIIFVAFILVVLYSQITGFGVSNYGIKRVLPRIIVAVIMVNLSFFISSLLVDISNIIGSGIVNFFTSIQADIELTEDPFRNISWSTIFNAFSGAGTIGFVIVAAMGGIKATFWIFVIALLGALISIIVGLITISLRQGVVLALIMISPLAFVAYLLPNTEKWFQKWKSLLAQMLFFYPMFSFLYGASKLAGWAIISTANKNPIFIILGSAIQVMPLFLSISLMKMSGTVLGNFNKALHSLSDPVRGGLTRWAASNAELNRQKHLRNNRVLTGARLQNYLAYRQQRRELDTGDLKATTMNRNLARSYNYRSSSKGLNQDGKDIWSNRPNQSTTIAKESSLQNSVTAAAQLNFSNTLGEYGDIFKSERAKLLGAAHGEAYLDIMRQQFRAENIAQGDQNFLLGRYLGAAQKQFSNPHEFNRLIGGATGKLGHSGETTIMGQVIKRSAEIEERRRAEARIVTTKFGVNKGEYRSMLLDKARVNDNGFEEDENGKPIEDSQYRYRDKDGNDTSSRHRDWGQYIGVHKTTRQEITKEEYDALSPTARKAYSKVKYMNITDDEGNVIQRVYDDDAGYMKEMLRKDIAIGDPINRRYATEIGVQLPDSEIARLQLKYPDIDWSHVNEVNKSGKLRRYHSTIAGALQESNYSEHAAEFAAMLTSQLDNGYVISAGQRNIAGLDSLWKASKTGKLALNDAFITKDWIKILSSIRSDAPEGERFEDYFPDIDTLLFRNVNGESLNGLRLSMNEEGHLTWKKIDRNAPDITLEDKKNWIKHMMIPEVAKKIYGSLNRQLSPNVSDGAKPDGITAFADMIDVLGQLGLENLDSNSTNAIPFEERLNPEIDIFSSKNPQELQEKTREWIKTVKETIPNYDNQQNNGGNGGGGNGGGASGFNRNLREAAYDDAYSNVPYGTVVQDVRNIFKGINSNFATVSQEIRTYFSTHSPLSNPDSYNALESSIETILDDLRSDNTYDAIKDITSLERDQQLIDKLYQEVISIINHAYSRF